MAGNSAFSVAALLLLALQPVFGQEVPGEGPQEVPEVPVQNCPVYPSCLSMNAERAPPPNLGVVGYWAMDDELNATYAAEYVLMNNATVSNAQVGFGGEGFLCGAADFALPQSSLSAGQNPAYDNASHSLSFWVNPMNASIMNSFAPLVSLENAAFGNIGYGVHLSHGQIEGCNTNVFYAQGNPLANSQYSTNADQDCIRYGDVNGTGTVLPLFVWTHVLFTSERIGLPGDENATNFLAIFLNGTQVLNANLTGAAAGGTIQTGTVNMGFIPGATEENNFTQFYGMLDEVMIHDHALSVAEAEALFLWFGDLKSCAEQPEAPEAPGEAPGEAPEVPEVPEIPEAPEVPLPPPITNP